MSNWDNLSDWYDRRQGDSGDLWHKFLIDPDLIRLVGDCRGRDVLDLGCGNGYLSRKFAREGAIVTAIDSSKGMIEKAKTHDVDNTLKIRYFVTDANHLSMVSSSSFDLVFANMSLMDIEDAEGAIKEVSRVLKQGGRFVASICHPCFDTMSNSAWQIEKKSFEPRRTYRKVRAYRKPFTETVYWRVDNGERIPTPSHHRPLSWYASVFSSSGLTITRMDEPEPTDEFMSKEEDSPGFLEVPLHIVFEAIKL